MTVAGSMNPKPMGGLRGLERRNFRHAPPAGSGRRPHSRYAQLSARTTTTHAAVRVARCGCLQSVVSFCAVEFRRITQNRSLAGRPPGTSRTTSRDLAGRSGAAGGYAHGRAAQATTACRNAGRLSNVLNKPTDFSSSIGASIMNCERSLVSWIDRPSRANFTNQLPKCCSSYREPTIAQPAFCKSVMIAPASVWIAGGRCSCVGITDQHSTASTAPTNF